MTTRRLLVVAGVVITLTLGVIFVSLAWSGARDKPAANPAAGPASDEAKRARAALAAELGVAAEEIEVASDVVHTWNDASLGLPEEGMMYAQVITEGHIVTLSHGGKTYVYHVAGQAVKLNPNAK